MRAWDALAVEPVAEGRYRAVIDPVWDLAMVPQGGIVAAVASRAMGEALATGQPLRSFHGAFVRPVPAGEVEAEVTVLRRGRSMSQARVDLAPPGEGVGLSAIGIFGGERPGEFDFTELVPPVVPLPEDCWSWRSPPPAEAGIEDWDGPWPFWGEVVEGRLALGHLGWDDSPRGAAEVANWFRFDDPPVGPDGLLDPLSLLVMADVMPGAVFERIGTRDQNVFAPSVDLSVHLFGHATPGWILAHAKAHLAADGYASAEMALWDPRADGSPKLVAWASQQMFFTQLTRPE